MRNLFLTKLNIALFALLIAVVCFNFTYKDPDVEYMSTISQRKFVSDTTAKQPNAITVNRVQAASVQ